MIGIFRPELQNPSFRAMAWANHPLKGNDGVKGGWGRERRGRGRFSLRDIIRLPDRWMPSLKKKKKKSKGHA